MASRGSGHYAARGLELLELLELELELDNPRLVHPQNPLPHPPSQHHHTITF